MADVAFRVEVDEALVTGREPVGVREIDRSGVDDGPFHKAQPGQFLDRPKAHRGGHRLGRVRAARERQGRIDDHVLLLADALDDPPVGLGVVALAAGRLVIGMHVDDRRPLLGAGDPLGDDLPDRDRDLRLQLPSPRPVQRHLQPDGPVGHRGSCPWLARRASSMVLSGRTRERGASSSGRAPKRSYHAAAPASLASIARATDAGLLGDRRAPLARR